MQNWQVVQRALEVATRDASKMRALAKYDLDGWGLPVFGRSPPEMLWSPDGEQLTKHLFVKVRNGQ